MSRGGNPKLMNNVMSNIRISIPCEHDEQIKISELISAFDNLIFEAEQELETWKNIKKGLLQQMFE